jgi:hypothetical protein
MLTKRRRLAEQPCRRILPTGIQEHASELHLRLPASSTTNRILGASFGFIPAANLPLPLVPPGAALRAPGALPKPGRCWWCPLQVPIQHEPPDHINGGPLHGRMDAVEEWITTAKATNAANPQG